MNDRCAAGTGRFLEGVARTLGMTLEDIGAATLADGAACEISRCVIFAETEIIGLVHRGTPREAVLQGAFRSVARKAAGLAYGVGIRDVVVLTGGGARYSGLKAAFQMLTGHQIIVPDQPPSPVPWGAAVMRAPGNTKGAASATGGRNKDDHGRTTKQCCADTGR